MGMTTPPVTAMTAEQELLRRLREALAAADLEVDDLLAEAWDDARSEVGDALRRLFTQDLLRRAIAAVEGEGPAPESRAPTAERAPAAERRRGDPEPARRSPRPGSRDVTSGRGVTYLYGIGGDDLTLPDEDLPLLPGGGELRMVAHGSLRAVVCDVDAAVFEVLNDAGPETLELLAEAARAHDAALAALAEEGAILPLRLGTVVADDAAVGDLLSANERELRAELDRIAGFSEWAVTVHVVDVAAGSSDEGGGPEAATSGRDYLEQRRVALEDRENRWELREELAAAIHEELAAFAAESLRVESRPLEDDTAPLLHSVHLVAHDVVSDFSTAVDGLRERYRPAIIDLSGPWPPYHFTAVDLSGEPPTS
jgi:hypothetical protein